MNEKTYDCDCGKLEPFQRDATNEDIRKGDLVRVEYAMVDLLVTRTGTAHERIGTQWLTTGGLHLMAGYRNTTITILSRPEPEPEPELPTTPGAVIRFERDGMLWVGVATLGGDKIWRGTFPIAGDVELTSDEVAEVRGTHWDRFEVVA